MTVTLIGVWLAAVGVGDLGRSTGDTPSRTRRSCCLLAGFVTLLVGLLLLRLAPVWFVTVGAILTACLLGWFLTSVVAIDPRRAARSRARARTLAFTALVAGVAVAAFAVQAVHRPLVWPDSLSDSFPARWSAPVVLVALGVLSSQLSTANLVVRLTLDAVGVPASTNEKELKGGRILGPMERLFIVALGALGELTAVAIVVAAKGLLRFPELQRAQRGPASRPDAAGPSDVTEYFLIGSFTSWLLALGGAALLYLSTTNG